MLLNYRFLLVQLGIQQAFSDAADLTAITNQKIKVDKVIQKAEIALDEHGVTAAAATGTVKLSQVLYNFSQSSACVVVCRPTIHH